MKESPKRTILHHASQCEETEFPERSAFLPSGCPRGTALTARSSDVHVCGHQSSDNPLVKKLNPGHLISMLICCFSRKAELRTFWIVTGAGLVMVHRMERGVVGEASANFIAVHTCGYCAFIAVFLRTAATRELMLRQNPARCKSLLQNEGSHAKA